MPRFVALLLTVHLTAYAQTKIPSINCPVHGFDETPASKGSPQRVSATPQVAKQLAYYSGILAPRGWHCAQYAGSDGPFLFITPEPFDYDEVFVGDIKYTGPIIIYAHHQGETSGRFDVAEVIGRPFPKYRKFIDKVCDGFEFMEFPDSPYPTDALTYKSDTRVEFTTPANHEGIGTQRWIAPDALPIRGVATLAEQGPYTPDASVLSVRLPAAQSNLTDAIIRQFERDTAQIKQ
jgi:hypothetical protein